MLSVFLLLRSHESDWLTMAVQGKTDDLATLASLDEAVLLQELKRRYEQDKIYVSLLREVESISWRLTAFCWMIQTYLGDVLVAVNPFKKLHIYEIKVDLCQHGAVYFLMTLDFLLLRFHCGWCMQERKRYHHVRSGRNESPPHVFAVASAAYHQMMATGKNQCCVIR